MQGLIRSSSELIVKEALALGADLVGGVDPAGLDGDMERSLQMIRHRDCRRQGDRPSSS